LRTTEKQDNRNRKQRGNRFHNRNEIYLVDSDHIGLCKIPSKVIPYSDTGSPNLFSVIKRISEICGYTEFRFCKALL
jgi:hypothetical protein